MAKVNNVLEKFKKKLNIDEVDEAKTLKDYGLDSLDMVELILELEDEYNIKFSDEEMTSLQTIGDLISAIHKKCGTE
ncbi:MAG: phosphopantetheine-binding protein [Bacilli bacterium]|jgi:acyl carrier protein|nr:phosphopantetheine-binding protein [Bacilli bacterium]MDD4005956.1 phosphopantetheine-binding protein [Bacilli bacterium]